jgi:hypothetical protein
MKRYFILLLIILASLTNCNLKRMLPNNRPLDPYGNLSGDDRFKLVEMYWWVSAKQVDEVQELLEKGYDPNHCLGEEGWMVFTPLHVLARSHYTTYPRRMRGETIPDPAPDVAILQLLVEAGADINRWPYIWCRVSEWDNFFIEDILQKTTEFNADGTPRVTQEEAEAEVVSFVDDVNRLLKAFLEAGADPDKLGHPYPYSYEGKMARINDEEAAAYFAEGTRAINEAIKKGMWWESQVDLLLQYTTLDEDSLKAAKESGDPAMVEKINKLWQEQGAR